MKVKWSKDILSQSGIEEKLESEVIQKVVAGIESLVSNEEFDNKVSVIPVGNASYVQDDLLELLVFLVNRTDTDIRGTGKLLVQLKNTTTDIKSDDFGFIIEPKIYGEVFEKNSLLGMNLYFEKPFGGARYDFNVYFRRII